MNLLKITWVNFLHFYQPPTADDQTVIEAAEKSYKRIIGAVKRNPNIKLTVNITGCLLDRLAALGYGQLIGDLKELSAGGRIELTGSAAFHPILALLPDREIIGQIKINEEILKKHFGQNFKNNGFFIPEAAYGVKVAKIVKKLNYRWLLLDEISAGRGQNRLDFSRLYIDKNSGLKIVFRHRQNSKGYVPQKIFEFINNKTSNTVITATDAELYGLRHFDFTGTFEKLLKRPEISALTISEYLNILNRSEKISLRASSWESTEQELKNNSPYFIWYNKKNNIQVELWRLAGLAIVGLAKYPHDQNYFWARQHLNRGLSSCAFWWASAHDFGLYGPVAWNPDEIEKGLNELIRSIRTLADPKTKLIKIKAEKLQLKIKQLVWYKHWNYYWRK